MLTITDADVRNFTHTLTEREYSPATISKYAHDLRLLMDYAPDGISDKAALVGFRAYLTERGYAPSSVNSILGAVNVFFELLGLDWRLNICGSSAKPSCPLTVSCRTASMNAWCAPPRTSETAALRCWCRRSAPSACA